ncbi:hypothetical protein EX30DRAFT_124633 [Ascodesmis nigricans]|uniref:Uncharacterized protein n=1 Tax=Ascodesmis nigricans TaxID=341454 RepID=A0A4S2MP52_9PEZI|nr:hypothetical protein EX30DRAFT_124633 [Ascodesmis nigricans]
MMRSRPGPELFALANPSLTRRLCAEHESGFTQAEEVYDPAQNRTRVCMLGVPVCLVMTAVSPTWILSTVRNSEPNGDFHHAVCHFSTISIILQSSAVKLREQ